MLRFALLIYVLLAVNLHEIIGFQLFKTSILNSVSLKVFKSIQNDIHKFNVLQSSNEDLPGLDDSIKLKIETVVYNNKIVLFMKVTILIFTTL